MDYRKLSKISDAAKSNFNVEEFAEALKSLVRELNKKIKTESGWDLEYDGLGVSISGELTLPKRLYDDFDSSEIHEWVEFKQMPKLRKLIEKFDSAYGVSFDEDVDYETVQLYYEIPEELEEEFESVDFEITDSAQINKGRRSKVSDNSDLKALVEKELKEFPEVHGIRLSFHVYEDEDFPGSYNIELTPLSMKALEKIASESDDANDELLDEFSKALSGFVENHENFDVWDSSWEEVVMGYSNE